MNISLRLIGRYLHTLQSVHLIAPHANYSSVSLVNYHSIVLIFFLSENTTQQQFYTISDSK